MATTIKEEIKTNIPPKIEKRNEFGLIENLEYKFNEEGGIDWRAMLPLKYLYINNDPKNRARIEKKYGKNYDEIDIIADKVEDSDLIQNLGAAKFLLKLRGFTDIQYNIKEANENYAAVNCRIIFRGNYESFNEPVPFEDNACATLNNTNGFGQKYILEMATNRAFTRCVRSACGISIVNKEELGGGSIEESSTASSITPQIENIIKKIELKMKNPKVNITWEQLKNKLVTKEKIPGAENFKSLYDVPKDVLFSLAERIEKKWPDE